MVTLSSSAHLLRENTNSFPVFATRVLVGPVFLLGLLALAIDAAYAFRDEEMPLLISCRMVAKVMVGVSDVDKDENTGWIILSIEFSEELKELLPDEMGNNRMRRKYKLRIFIEEKASSISEVEWLGEDIANGTLVTKGALQSDLGHLDMLEHEVEKLHDEYAC
ncbi:hypothetical protein Tco_0300455 [Tanacetum coccineum]